MRYPFTLLLLVLAGITARAQRLDVAITHWLGARTNTSTSGQSISTKDGGLLFIGYTNCFDGGGFIPANFHDTGTNGANLVIAKLDSNRHTEWTKVYGGTGADAYAVAVEVAGGGYAVLATTSSNDRDVTGNHGEADMWLLRLDAGGNIVWQKCYGGPHDEYATSIVQTPDGGFALLGVSNGAGGDVPKHYAASGPRYDYDWFMVKTDAAGNTQWTKTIGGTGEEQWARLLIGNDAIYLAGSSSSQDYDCTAPAPPKWTTYDYFLIKMDITGNQLWNRRFGVLSVDAAVAALWDARDSSIIMTGTSGDETTWLLKTDASGMTKWERSLGDGGRGMGRSIAIAQHGYMVVSSVKDDFSHRNDIKLRAMDMDGNTLAIKDFGGTGDEWPNTIVAYRDGFAITGFSDSHGFDGCTNTGNIPDSAYSAFISEITFSPTGTPHIDPLMQRFALAPNPVDHMCELTLPNSIGGTVELYNTMGVAIYRWEVPGPQQHLGIRLDHLFKGIYIMKWTGNDGTIMTTKLFKE